MDGVHDLGGLEGFGPVVVERAEPVFHAPWEARAFATTMATFAAGLSNGGQFRHSIERMDAVHYLTSPYYEHWVTGVATRAVEAGRIPLDELERRAGGRVPLSRPAHVAHAVVVDRPAGGTPAFVVGDAVQVRELRTRGHTRCPGYVRGRRGTVVRIDPGSSLPDVEAHSEERVVEPVYCVGFTAAELWGGDDVDRVHVDLWESYLRAA